MPFNLSLVTWSCGPAPVSTPVPSPLLLGRPPLLPGAATAPLLKMVAHRRSFPLFPLLPLQPPLPPRLRLQIGSSLCFALFLPVKLMECFLRVAEANTKRSLETCGVLAGTLKKRTFYVTSLIIPKQKSTANTCEATNEEELFEVQDMGSLFTLGWIHTHPTQSCFLSSIDLHNHYSYQVMLPEAIAIVMAPTDTTRKHGIFHLTDPGGMGVIHDCQERGFHPHKAPPDGSPIYEHCSHVYLDADIKFDTIDLRER